MLKITTTLKAFEQAHGEWAWVTWPGVPARTYIVTNNGEIFKVLGPHENNLRLAQIESKGEPHGSGQYMSHLRSLNGVQLHIPTAKLVARAFVQGETKEKNMLIYKDGNKLNVHASNLVWASYNEVMQAYHDRKKSFETTQKERDGFVLESSKLKSEEIEKVLAEEDSRLECMREPKPCDDAVWEGEELGWVVYSKEPKERKYVEQSSYDRTEREEKAQEIKSNKQLRLAYKWGNVKQQNNDYDPEGEF